MRPPILIPVEICIDCTDPDSMIRSVTAAKTGGAQRVELCSRMDVGGLTPNAEFVGVARHIWGFGDGLMVMVRPRAGDFTYKRQEISLMVKAIQEVAEAGADGVVLGAVRDGNLDANGIRRLMRTVMANEIGVTCHRAFDAVDDSRSALALLSTLDVDRVLTSGTPWGSGLGVEEGVEQLIQLRRQAKPWMEIVLGGGVNAATIGPILAQLPLDAGPVSIHAYSSVLRNGVTDEGAVAELVAVANRAARDWMDHNP